MNEAQALRDHGITRAVNHADRVHSNWSDRAFDSLKQFIQTKLRKGDVITSEAVRSYAATHGLPTPPDKRAWGAIMLKAARAKLIVKKGWTTATDPKVHCNPVSLWEIQ
jgi:hypothetical protein